MYYVREHGCGDMGTDVCVPLEQTLCPWNLDLRQDLPIRPPIMTSLGHALAHT